MHTKINIQNEKNENVFNFDINNINLIRFDRITQTVLETRNCPICLVFIT